MLDKKEWANKSLHGKRHHRVECECEVCYPEPVARLDEPTQLRALAAGIPHSNFSDDWVSKLNAAADQLDEQAKRIAELEGERDEQSAYAANVRAQRDELRAEVERLRKGLAAIAGWKPHKPRSSTHLTHVHYSQGREDAAEMASAALNEER